MSEGAPGGGREEEEEKKEEEEVSMERDRGEQGGLHFAALARARARAQIPELTGYGNEIAAREFAINLPPAAAAARMPEHA